MFPLKPVRGLELGLRGVHGGAVWKYATLEPLKDYDGPTAKDIRTTTKAYVDNANALKEDSPRDTIPSPERALEQSSLHSATGKSPPQPRSTMTPRSTHSQPFLDVSPNAATKDHTESHRRGTLSRQTSRAAPRSYAAHPRLWRLLQASSGGNRGPRLDNTGTRRAQSTSTAPRYPRLFSTRLAQHAFFHGGLIA